MVIICKCFVITDTKIKKIGKENNLKTVDEVTHFSKAGGACGSCKGDIQKIIDEVNGKGGTKGKCDASMRKLSNIQKMHLIEDTIMNKIRPALKHDGGNIVLLDLVDNNVYVKLEGACAVCPASGSTLKNYVEKTLREVVSDDLVVVDSGKCEI